MQEQECQMGLYDWRYYLTWNGRISPRDYMTGQVVIGVAGLIAALPLFAVLKFRADQFALPFVIGLVAVLTIPGSSLLIRRAHDLGWPAAASLTASAVPLGLVLALFARSALFGHELAQAQWIRVATSVASVIAVFVFTGALSAILSLKSGRPAANRYGPAPAEPAPRSGARQPE